MLRKFQNMFSTFCWTICTASDACQTTNRVPAPVSKIFANLWQLERRLGRRSAQRRLYGSVAQWIARRTSNPEVVGSSPIEDVFEGSLSFIDDPVIGRLEWNLGNMNVLVDNQWKRFFVTILVSLNPF